MSRTATLADAAAVSDSDPVEVRRPPVQSVAVVLASPHSGREYPPTPLSVSRGSILWRCGGPRIS